MPSLPAKKVPPPPKEPGTHTNAEVKEALHARALRRTILITAVVFLLLASLAIVSNTAREVVGDTGKPKLILLVAHGLTPASVERARRSNKAPFLRLLSRTGGQFGTLSASYVTPDPLINLLTGSENVTANTLHGRQSILGWLKEKALHTVVAAPSAYWSYGTADGGSCTHVGLFDTECSNQQCPATNDAAYCNAYRKYITCEDRAQLYNNEITRAFQAMVNHSADALYFQLGHLAEADVGSADVDLAVQERSEVNLLDAAVGRIVLALAARTAEIAENWLLIVTSDGDNAAQVAPLLMLAYTKGELVQLKALSASAKTTDVAKTIQYWFEDTSVNSSSVLGICSNGAKVTNC